MILICDKKKHFSQLETNLLLFFETNPSVRFKVYRTLNSAWLKKTNQKRTKSCAFGEKKFCRKKKEFHILLSLQLRDLWNSFFYFFSSSRKIQLPWVVRQGLNFSMKAIRVAAGRLSRLIILQLQKISIKWSSQRVNHTEKNSFLLKDLSFGRETLVESPKSWKHSRMIFFKFNNWLIWWFTSKKSIRKLRNKRYFFPDK